MCSVCACEMIACRKKFRLVFGWNAKDGLLALSLLSLVENTSFQIRDVYLDTAGNALVRPDMTVA